VISHDGYANLERLSNTSLGPVKFLKLMPAPTACCQGITQPQSQQRLGFLLCEGVINAQLEVTVVVADVLHS
jgi:hypothetical protein